MEIRTLSKTRRFTEFAVSEERRLRDPLRTEVVKNNKTESYYCRACRVADDCRHVVAVQRFASRMHLTMSAASAPTGDAT